MAKKKPKFHNLCKDCIMRDCCQFKDKNNPEATVVGLFGNEGIGLECPEELGGYPELPGMPPVEEDKKKNIDFEKDNQDDPVMINGKGLTRIINQLKTKKIVFKNKTDIPKKEPEEMDSLDRAFTKKIAENKDKK